MIPIEEIQRLVEAGASNREIGRAIFAARPWWKRWLFYLEDFLA